MKKFRLKLGFTLAETLIALVIIGVVAAITIPTLSAMYQQQITIQRLKKVYSTFSQVSNRIAADNGGFFCDRNQGLECLIFIVKELQNGGWPGFSQRYFEPYMNIMKTNDSMITLQECLTPGECGTSDPLYGFYMADGTTVALYPEIYGNDLLDNTLMNGVALVVDINGEKKPNKFGRDMFLFEYRFADIKDSAYMGRIIPFGLGFEISELESYYGAGLGCTRDNPMLCATKIVNDGWQIKRDYPW